MRKFLLAALACTLTLSACDRDQADLPPVVTGVGYVGATVSNLDQTIALYEQSANLKEVQAVDISNVNVMNQLMGREDVNLTARMLRSTNAQIRYMQFDETSDLALQTSAVRVNGPGIAHICFQVNAETKTYEKILEHGAEHIGAREMQQLSSRNPVHYAYVRDKDGIVVEIEHVDFAKLELDTPPKYNNRIRHVSLSTPDIDRLVDFYSAFLRERKPRRIGRFWALGNERVSNVTGLPGTKVKMAWFQLRNLELEIVEYVSHPVEALPSPRPLDAVGYNMIVFDVSDLKAAQEAFVAAGGTIVSDVEFLDGGQVLFGRDPDKNLIGLQLPGPNSVVSSEPFEDNPGF